MRKRVNSRDDGIVINYKMWPCLRVKPMRKFCSLILNFRCGKTCTKIPKNIHKSIKQKRNPKFNSNFRVLPWNLALLLILPDMAHTAESETAEFKAP